MAKKTQTMYNWWLARLESDKATPEQHARILELAKQLNKNHPEKVILEAVQSTMCKEFAYSVIHYLLRQL
jgi:hypothetical protein